MVIEFGKYKIQIIGSNPEFVKTNMMIEFESAGPVMVAFQEEFTHSGALRVRSVRCGSRLSKVMNMMLFLASDRARMMIGGPFPWTVAIWTRKCDLIKAYWSQLHSGQHAK